MGANSTTAFPDKLKAGDSTSANHKLTRNGYASGVEFVTDTVVYPNPYPPYTSMLSQEETVAYLPQSYSGSTYNLSTISFTNPFAITNSASYTLFVRFKWDGTARKQNTARFISAGYGYGAKCGFLLGVDTSGRFVVYTRGGASGTSTSATLSSPTVSANQWTDCAIVVADNTMTIYIQKPGSAVQYGVMSTSFGTLAMTGSSSTIHLGGEKGQNGGDAVEVFPGYFHAFASWQRALSADEVKEVFAYPMTRDLVRLGTPNGSSLEFKGASQGGAAAGSATEDWAQFPASVNAESDTAYVSFTVPARDAGLPQFLRVKFADDSSNGELSASVNGEYAGKISALAGKASVIQVKGNQIRAGVNTLALTRNSSSGDVKFDAVALGGGFRIGDANNSKTELAENPASTSNPFYACCTNAVWTNVRQNLNAQGNADYSQQRIHVFVPDEVAGNSNCSVTFTARVYLNSNAHTYALYVNGESEPEATMAYTAASAWRDFSCKVSASKLVPGYNVFRFANVTTTGGYLYASSVDCYKFEPKVSSGSMIIVF